MGNILGSIIATTVLYMLPELLREFADYRMLIYAIVLILVMIATNGTKAKQITENLKLKIKGIFTRKNSNNDGGEVTDNG